MLPRQLECADRQLRASRQFVEELTHDRESEVENFTSAIDRLQEQLKDHQHTGDSNARLSQVRLSFKEIGAVNTTHARLSVLHKFLERHQFQIHYLTLK